MSEQGDFLVDEGLSFLFGFEDLDGVVESELAVDGGGEEVLEERCVEIGVGCLVLMREEDFPEDLGGLFEKVCEKGWEIELMFVVGFLAFFERFG